MGRHSYRIPPFFTLSRKILLEKTMEPLAAKFVGTGVSNFKTVFSSYMFLTQYVHLVQKNFPILHIFLKNFP